MPPTPRTNELPGPTEVVDHTKAAALVDELRARAELLRREADQIERTIVDLAAYDRPDVWQGARASVFREHLGAYTRALTAPYTGACSGLRDAATRIEARAAHVDGFLRAAAEAAGAPPRLPR